MTDADTREFLLAQHVAHVGTVDAKGGRTWCPRIYIYEGNDACICILGTTTAISCRIFSAIHAFASKSERWDPCTAGTRLRHSALVFTTVIAFGPVRLITDRDKKSWFFDQVLAKYGEPGWTFEPGYPLLDRIILYEQQIEMVTGKHSEGLYH